MDEYDLARRHACRLTRNLIDTWTAPDGIEVYVLCHHNSREVDVAMMAGGILERNRNVRFEDEATAHAVLDCMASDLMRICVAAYEGHELTGKEDVILNMTLSQAGRKFGDFIDSLACKGIGGGE